MGSLEDARRVYFDLAEGKGSVCPCCDRFGRKYRRKFNSGMARSLIWMVRYFEQTNDWIDMSKKAPRHVIKSREFDKLSLWWMAEELVNSDTEKRTSGIWRPLEAGIRFVHKELRVRSHAVVYNSKAEKFQGAKIDIEEALGKHFSYRELMSESIII